MSPSGLEDRCWRIGKRRGVVVAPGSGGLRTPAGKCRPLGLKTDAGASGKEEGWWWRPGPVAYAHRQRSFALRAEDRCWRIGKWLFGFSPEGGIGTAGVRKPPVRESPHCSSARRATRRGAIRLYLQYKILLLSDYLHFWVGKIDLEPIPMLLGTRSSSMLREPKFC